MGAKGINEIANEIRIYYMSQWVMCNFNTLMEEISKFNMSKSEPDLKILAEVLSISNNIECIKPKIQEIKRLENESSLDFKGLTYNERVVLSVLKGLNRNKRYESSCFLEIKKIIESKSPTIATKDKVFVNGTAKFPRKHIDRYNSYEELAEMLVSIANMLYGGYI